ncbi:MAG: hypothetical protein HY820_21380 [Acidobacteria bacterium]|nr:hypothetical protein [Acidobacteriota bacterium]
MANTIPFPAQASAGERATTRSSAIPWYLWCAVFSVTSAMVGAHWDISWHRSIGRDTFWTPAHIAIYLCGILAGISCAYLILSRSFGFVQDQAVVRMWGFRAPLGAFLASWGGVAMLTSAPFDDWWHSAYGLDVKIVSPPHVLLIFGTFMVMMGALVLTLGQMNRASGAERGRLNAIFLYIGAMIVVLLMIFLMEYTIRPMMHTAGFYKVIGVAVPFALAGLARASGLRWASTIAAAIYSVFLIGCVWILPLFPAEPKLGPVYFPVTHFVPPEWPLLFIVPAVALDLLWKRTASWNKWLLAAVSGIVFMGLFLAVQWPFADFLQSPAARNAFFGAKYFGYYTHPNSALFQYRFLPVEPDFAKGILLAFVFSMISMRVGLGWGDWMRKVRR